MKYIVNQFVDKYKKLPVQVKASAWFLVCAFMQRGISVLSTPIFTRILTTAEYGQYNVFNSWLGIITVFVSLNLYAGVFAQGIVKFDDERRKFASSLQGLCITLDAGWTIIYLVFRDFFNDTLGLTTVQMLAMFVMIWATAAYNFWSVDQRVDFKYRKLVLITIITSIAKPVVGIFLILHAEDKVTARILGLALVEVVAYLGLSISSFVKGKTFYSKKYWKYALSFNIPLIPHYLSQTVLNSADRVMIERMVGASEAGIYSLAYAISCVMTLFNTALEQTLEPWIYKKIKERKIEELSSVAYPSFICIAAVNVLLVAFAPEIVRMFAPLEYYDAIWVIPPVAASTYFTFMYSFFASFEFYFEKTKFVSVATMCGAVVNIILNYVFIKIFGYIAAGYTTLLCYFLYAFCHYICMRKICSIEFDGCKPYDEKILLIITIVFLTIVGLLLISYNYLIIRIVLIVGILLLLFVFRNHIRIALKELLFKKKE
jgi:O-antigen/teichoic acid export membrane protein